MRVHLVTLGCPKNLVDSEAALGLLARAGCRPCNDPRRADLLVVNACSFLEAAWRETVDELRRLDGLRRPGQRLVLMGCLPRHRRLDLRAELPFVDHVVPSGEHARLVDLASARAVTSGRATVDHFAGYDERLRLGGRHAAYVKLAEGCNRACTFCAIPAIRGRQRNRPAREIVAEVEALVADGVREVTLLAQDIVSWRDGAMRLPELAADIARTGVPWIRVFYVHPAGIDAAWIERLFTVDAVCRYLEMPIQHASDRILAAMRRGHDAAHVVDLLRAARAAFPDLVVRTEVVVGFPGETDDDFDALRRAVEELAFDSLGVFPYSPEPNTPAASLGGRVDPALVRQRAADLADLQEAVAFGVRSRLIGTRQRVLVEHSEPGGVWGRFYGQAPGIDGRVRVRGTSAPPGAFVDAWIRDADAHDLDGVSVGDGPDDARAVGLRRVAGGGHTEEP